MFLAFKIIKKAYSGLLKLDSSDGKSRQEKISGIRYLIATSELLHVNRTTDINLAVGSELRNDFVFAVGNLVALNEYGLYSKDFHNEFDTKKDYGTGSNFFTTRLANSRVQDINYPSRPTPLLFLSHECVSILPDACQKLSESYGIKYIKPEFCCWLLRNENFNLTRGVANIAELKEIIEQALSNKYTPDIVKVIIPSEVELQNFLSEIDNFFVDEKQNYEDLSKTQIKKDSTFGAKILIDNLIDDDQIFNIVQQLLARGAKGILFSGPPGTSKTWYASKIAIKITNGDKTKLERVQFHPSFTYEDFIEGLVSSGSINSSEPMFKPKSKVFLNLCDKARIDSDNLYILIIDEFSRGDPSKIFGELLTYIEPDYREINFRLPYSEKETSIPQNVVIFATSNPYDKSVSDLDSAMERRFEVIEILPNVDILKSFLIDKNFDELAIDNIITFFNQANNFSPHGFGHAYFKDVKEEVDLILLWNHKLKFIFEKMFRFKEDAYKEVRQSFIEIISDSRKRDVS